MSDTVTEPIIAEFAQIVKSFQIAFKLDNQQMLTIVSESAEMIKRAIRVEKISKDESPADEVTL